MRGEGQAPEPLAPDLEAFPLKRLAVEHARRAPLPQGEQLAVMVEHGDVGGVDVVGAAHRGTVVDGRRKAREEPAPRLGLAHELRGCEHAGAVRDPAALEAKRLHHAVAVEQVPVPKSEALVHRRSVAVERPLQPGRQMPLDARFAPELVGLDAVPAQERRVRLERTGEIVRPVAGTGGDTRDSERDEARETRRVQETPAGPSL